MQGLAILTITTMLLGMTLTAIGFRHEAIGLIGEKLLLVAMAFAGIGLILCTIYYP